MTHQDFVKKRLWGKINYDRAFWYQCTDLWKQYMKELYWKHIGKWWNANQIWHNTYKPFWKWRVRINHTNDLQQWDIIISLRWKYWHIAIVHEWFTVLEQNGVWWANGRWWNAIRLKTYNRWFFKWVWRYQW